MVTINKDAQMSSRIIWAFVAFLAFIFLTGGASRADVQSLVFLRPLCALVLGCALWFLTPEKLRHYRAVALIALAIFTLVASHLIPLPSSVWQQLPQGEVYAKVDSMVGLGDVARPLSMVPPGTWNALFALVVPFAVLFWAMQIDGKVRHKVVTGLVVIGMLSCLLGLLQIIGPSKGPFYLYRITNNGTAVGFFANRNHHAVFLACMFPLLAVYATTYVQNQEQAMTRRWIAFLCGAFVLPMILVTGSRAGLAMAVIGLAAVPLLSKLDKNIAPAKRKTRSAVESFFVQHFNKIFVGVGGVLLIASALYFSRAVALDRLSELDGAQDLRFDYWRISWEVTRHYFPFGSGIGSFVEVFQIFEPDELLVPTYANHAHNDWIEAVMTGGIVAALILLALIVMWCLTAIRWFRNRDNQDETSKFAGLGLVVILILSAASIFDYPLRVPSISALFALSMVWLCDGMRRANIAGTR